MGNGMNKVLPGLYVGNIRDSEDKVQLEKNNITHILSIHDRAAKKLKDKKYLCINASDNASQDINQYFSLCNDFIHGARLEGGGVLIHCLAGVSRSVTVTVAYVMTITDLGWRDALGVVRAARNCANPNFGFQRQLLAFEHEGLTKERKRFKEKWEETSHDDRALCKELLVIHLKWVLEGDNPSAAAERNYPLAHDAYKPKTESTANTDCDEANNHNDDAKETKTENGSSDDQIKTTQANANEVNEPIAKLALGGDELNANQNMISQGDNTANGSLTEKIAKDQSSIDQAKIDEFFTSSTKL